MGLPVVKSLRLVNHGLVKRRASMLILNRPFFESLSGFPKTDDLTKDLRPNRQFAGKKVRNASVISGKIANFMKDPKKASSRKCEGEYFENSGNFVFFAKKRGICDFRISFVRALS